MPEPFEDMVLTRAQIDNGVAWFVVEEPNGERWTYRERTGIAKMQHEADMAHEIACPSNCHTSDIAKAVRGTTLAEAWLCPTCGNTGRVTLGALVAADRAKKVTGE